MTRNPTNRSSQDLRPITLETQVNRYAEGSAIIRCGETHVLCTASIEDSVPKWLTGKGQGWITAEYAMLPRATHTRTKRDREKVSGRTQEIQRLIGRALRACVDLSAIGERTLMIDCDVLQADGGTRTASITGSCVALAIAIDSLVKKNLISKKAWLGTVCALSLGMMREEILVDLDYNEDSSCDVDMNFVITQSGQLVEVQGTAEKKPFSGQALAQMLESALRAGEKLTELQQRKFKELGLSLS